MFYPHNGINLLANCNTQNQGIMSSLKSTIYLNTV